MSSTLPVPRFDNKLYSFNFRLTKNYVPEITEIIGYGLCTLVSLHFNVDGEFGDVLGMDSAKYVIGEQLSNLYINDGLHKEMCLQCELELYYILNTPAGEALVSFLQSSTGFTDCFPVGGNGAMSIIIREGYGENRAGSFFNLNDSIFTYQEFNQMFPKGETTLCPLPEQPLLDFSGLAF